MGLNSNSLPKLTVSSTRRLVQDLFIPLLQQNEALQWLKVFLSLSTLASSCSGFSAITEVVTGFPSWM